MNIGIVSLQRHPPDVYNWLRYHRDVGITHFYIWLEDSDELKPLLEQYGASLGAHVYAEIGSVVDRDKEDNYTDLMTRQQQFVNRMIRQSRLDGVEWIFHIDDDELIHPTSKPKWQDVLQAVDPGCASIHMTNWEGFSPAQPAGSWITDSGVKYMKDECAHLYAAYSNGKSASRTVPGQDAWGPHHFKGGKECELPTSEGVVLHHDSLAMDSGDVPPRHWLEKNRLRAHSDLSKIPFEAALESVKAVKSGSLQEQQMTWEKYRSQKGTRFGSCQYTESLELPSYYW